MILRKSGRIARNMQFSYKLNEIEIVNTLTYLGMVFTTGGAFNDTFDALSGQALKSIYTLKTYLSFTQLKVSHYCELFDKLIISEVWGSLKRRHTRDHSCSML